MSPLRLARFLVLVAMIGAVSCIWDTPCTPATCVNGPVVAYFNSLDCSGTPSFYNYADDDPSTYGSCIEEPTRFLFHRMEITNDFIAYIEVNNPSCDVTLSNASYFIQQDFFGKCRPASSESWMILPNANATYTSPQPPPVVDLSHRDFNEGVTRASCDSVTNCTMDGMDPELIQYYSSPTDCSLTSASGTYNASYSGNTCFAFGDLFYATRQCLDEHAFGFTYYLDSACQNAVHAEYHRAVCVVGSTTRIYSCLTTPIPLPDYFSPPSPPFSPPSSPFSPPSSPSSPPSSPSSPSSSPSSPSSSPSSPSPSSSPSGTPSAVPTSSATSILPTFLLLIASFFALLF